MCFVKHNMLSLTHPDVRIITSGCPDHHIRMSGSLHPDVQIITSGGPDHPEVPVWRRVPDVRVSGKRKKWKSLAPQFFHSGGVKKVVRKWKFQKKWSRKPIFSKKSLLATTPRILGGKKYVPPSAAGVKMVPREAFDQSERIIHFLKGPPDRGPGTRRSGSGSGVPDSDSEFRIRSSGFGSEFRIRSSGFGSEFRIRMSGCRDLVRRSGFEKNPKKWKNTGFRWKVDFFRFWGSFWELGYRKRPWGIFQSADLPLVEEYTPF